MHLDLEGGVTERRTKPSSTAEIEQTLTHVSNAAALARVAVELEETLGDMKTQGHESVQNTESGTADAKSQKLKRAKKKVAFHSDKPDLYDF